MNAKAMSIGLALLAAGCALQGYQPQPLDPARSQAAVSYTHLTLPTSDLV